MDPQWAIVLLFCFVQAILQYCWSTLAISFHHIFSGIVHALLQWHSNSLQYCLIKQMPSANSSCENPHFHRILPKHVVEDCNCWVHASGAKASVASHQIFISYTHSRRDNNNMVLNVHQNHVPARRLQHNGKVESNSCWETFRNCGIGSIFQLLHTRIKQAELLTRSVVRLLDVGWDPERLRREMHMID